MRGIDGDSNGSFRCVYRKTGLAGTLVRQALCALSQESVQWAECAEVRMALDGRLIWIRRNRTPPIRPIAVGVEHPHAAV